ncbi:MAG TPA: hydrogenase nickel incorporation protein HypB [Casimicrobiaceae bacterium]
MCTTCGCGDGDTRIEGVPLAVGGHAHEHAPGTATAHTHWRVRPGGSSHAPVPVHLHAHADGTWHSHVHGGGSAQGHPGADALGATHEAGMPAERIVRIEQDILARNDAFAARNRQAFADRANFALNLVSSPGSGKTTLLVRTIQALQDRMPVCVIEGDQQTSLDADRIRATGAAAIQVNTGKGCHLDAHMVGQALSQLDPAEGGLVMIENVGNLVCPAAFDLGEAHKVVILSVTEGSDKPLKYPDMFRAADLMLINKTDLLPHVQFDVDAAVAYARRMRPGLEVICLSATTGEGLDAWLAWLERGVATVEAARDRSVAALRRRVAELEAKLTAMDASA